MKVENSHFEQQQHSNCSVDLLSLFTASVLDCVLWLRWKLERERESAIERYVRNSFAYSHVLRSDIT
jgi:hypothetical protein